MISGDMWGWDHFSHGRCPSPPPPHWGCIYPTFRMAPGDLTTVISPDVADVSWDHYVSWHHVVDIAMSSDIAPAPFFHATETIKIWGHNEGRPKKFSYFPQTQNWKLGCFGLLKRIKTYDPNDPHKALYKPRKYNILYFFVRDFIENYFTKRVEVHFYSEICPVKINFDTAVDRLNSKLPRVRNKCKLAGVDGNITTL